MELGFEQLLSRTLELAQNWDEVAYGPERIPQARQCEPLILRELTASMQSLQKMRDHLSHPGPELLRRLADTSLQASSFLFAAGAGARDWRSWCGVAGYSYFLSGDPSFALQLCTIARAFLSRSAINAIAAANIRGFREQVVRRIVLENSEGALSVPSRPQEPDRYYIDLLDHVGVRNEGATASTIEEIAAFWLEEVHDGEFEPGVFPIFEPEINAVVAALVSRGWKLSFRNESVRAFLEAGLDPGLDSSAHQSRGVEKPAPG